jgi:UTP--glucose-1-phosphate uridylyltransferase
VPGLSKALLPVNNLPALSVVVMEALEIARSLEPTKTPHVTLVVPQAPRDPVLNQPLQNPSYFHALKIAGVSNYTTIVQPEPLGLGHAILTGMKNVNSDHFLITLPDEIVIKSDRKLPYIMKPADRVYHKKDCAFVLCRHVYEPERYGILQLDLDRESKTHALYKVTEKPKGLASGLAVRGRYLLHKNIREYLVQSPTNEAGEIDLSWALSQVGVQPTYLEDHAEIYDIGTPSSYLDMCAELKRLGDQINGG